MVAGAEELSSIIFSLVDNADVFFLRKSLHFINF